MTVYAKLSKAAVWCVQNVCDWKDYKESIARVTEIVQDQLEKKHLPSVEPHHSILYPFTAAERKAIAASSANLCTDMVCWTIVLRALKVALIYQLLNVNVWYNQWQHLDFAWVYTACL